MEAAFVILAFVGAGAAYYYAHARQKRFEAALQAVAAAHGLDFTPATWRSSAQIAGTVDGVHVVLDSYTQGSGKSSQTYTRARASGPLPADLSLAVEGFGSALGKLFKGEDLQVGDAFFDGRVLIRGDSFDTLARLDDAGRDAVLDALAADVQVTDGEAITRTSGHVEHAYELEAMLQKVLALVRALDHGGDPGARLARAVAADPSPGFRLRALEALVGRRHPAAKDAARAALDSDHAPLRLQAAMALGAEGAPIVEAAARDQRLSAALRLDAIDWLARNHPAPDPVLETLAADDAWAVAAAAIEGLTRRGKPTPLDTLVRHSTADDAGLRARVARALAAHKQEAAAEAVALTLLKDDVVEVAVAAARALVRVGSVRAVQPLLARGEGLLTSGELKQATRAAVEAIQSRLGDVQRGGLSIAADAGPRGGLAVVDEE
ncbi:MAG: hypothetical protein H6704_24620 [Myxococcales bacterium]|nr:hypothetical protein [Myxococcales bacterium]